MADTRRGGKTTSGNGQAWSSPSHRAQWRTEKMEETGCKIICGAPTTLAVKGLMMMMMIAARQSEKRELDIIISINQSIGRSI